MGQGKAAHCVTVLWVFVRLIGALLIDMCGNVGFQCVTS